MSKKLRVEKIRNTLVYHIHYLRALLVILSHVVLLCYKLCLIFPWNWYDQLGLKSMKVWSVVSYLFWELYDISTVAISKPKLALNLVKETDVKGLFHIFQREEREVIVAVIFLNIFYLKIY
jgi:hypothetical protein